MTLSVTCLASSLIYIVLPNFFCFHISSISSTLFPRSSKIVLYRWYLDFLIVRKIEKKWQDENQKNFFNPFNATGLLRHPLKTENQRFSDVFRVSKEISGMKWVKEKSTVIKGSSPNFLSKNKLIAESCRFV